MFLREHGIEHQTTVPYSPQQNGVAERANRTIMEAARCMLQDAGMDKRLWAEAVNTAIYIKNKSPSRAVKGTTPEEKWTDATWTPGMATDATSSDYEDVEESAAIVRSATEMCQSDEPLTIQDALSSPEKEHWKKAIADEYESFEKNKAWNLTLLPEGKKAVKCKWVFKKKLGPNGELKRYKARLVAKGFTQRYGIDYKETYSPVVIYSTIRTLLALAVNLNMHVDHMDVKTAFLNGDLAETVFMEQLDGYKVEGKEDKDTPEKEKLKEELMRTFEMRDLGRANHILGMNLRQEENKITLDQKNYIMKVLEQFNMSDCKPVGTPLEIGMKFEKGEKNDIDSNYRSLMGCIMYIADMLMLTGRQIN
ncbi:uncharacterized protein LOC119691389 [Plutella xylostella]|uniref:uncharacterized protein LOC119691389 n=1 Tax=Plutella xylostella TaxID=51655 RepID=UPI002032AE88|nr:uncharacterized protein LOC119691389 [Plutella xylostella]